MPLNFDDFKVSKYYRPMVLGMEEESQDPMDMRRAHRKDQEEQYARYLAQQDQGIENVGVAQHMKREGQSHPLLRKALHNTETALRNGDNDVLRKEKWNAYMREHRRKPKYCPHCKKEL